VITIALDEWVETAVILLAVFVNAALGFYQEYRAENTLERLEVYMKDRARVIRGGREYEIESSFLVPGDIVRLSLGTRVPADVRMISENGLSVDESFLTGESLPVQKHIEVVSEGAPVTERLNMAFAGALVVEGSAYAVVVGTGEHTEIGRIAELVRTSDSEATPLQKSLSHLAWAIFAGVSVIVSGLFFLGISRGEPILEMLLLAVATAIGAVPEALPIALTVILAVGVERITAQRGIMRSLAAAETLGSTTIVMTDKTGTLTQAKMSVTGILTREALAAGDAPNPEMDAAEKHILESALMATDAVVENPDDPREKWRFIGRPLETNIGLAARDAGVDVLRVLRERRMPLLAFNSTNKFAVAKDLSTKQLIALGAPDILLQRSKLTKDEYIVLEKRIQELSEEGKRLVGVAHVPGSHEKARDFTTEDAMEFLGVIVLYDPIRKEAAGAVRRIERHGARVVMLTGDLKGTAMAIARELGWEVSEAHVMTGTEIRQLSDDELMARLPLIKICARVTPEDKLRIGRLFQQSGEIVAMTGDGVNDAPSLKAVNIGIALGSGTDVAKSAADLVLLDDNFETIVRAIEEGRRIISNIRKTFVYLMSNCLDEVFLIGGALIFALPLPLSAIQIIWVNFFTGSLPALAYAFEKNRDVAGDHARGAIFNTQVQVLTIGIGILTSFLLFVFYAGMLHYEVSVPIARTVLFLCFASYILVVAFSFKSLHEPLFSYPLFDNQALNWGIFVAAALLLASILIPGLRELLDLVPISPFWVSVVIGWLVFIVAIVEAAKLAFRAFKF
jgi:Ca2+-transporting ATPase